MCSCQRTLALETLLSFPEGFNLFKKLSRALTKIPETHNLCCFSLPLVQLFPAAVLGAPSFPFPLWSLVGVTGLEPVTLRLSSACSNQLSYTPIIKSQDFKF